MHTHSQALFVTHEGCVVRFDADDLRRLGAKPARRKQMREFGAYPATSTIAELERATSDVTIWTRVKSVSELLSTRIGVDELRVDWLFGDACLGPRIGELTYIGGGFDTLPLISEAFCTTFCEAHRRRAAIHSFCSCGSSVALLPPQKCLLQP